MITHIILIGIGGAAGSILRFLLQQYLNENFPYGTLIVNIVGCLLIGMLWGIVTKGGLNEQMKLLFITGFCGGFTTLSSFSYEGNLLLMQGRIFYFTIYFITSTVGGLLATFLGYKIFAR